MESIIPARDISVIIPQILAFIPKEEVLLRNELTVYNDSLFNQSPESRRTTYCWLPVQNILQKNIPVFQHDWQKKVHALFCNE
uniref:Uncharacterized protein n=1 Tax=viral metagenome TaxID=1070528 RepID=A0A6C0B157_9ZZZZ